MSFLSPSSIGRLLRCLNESGVDWLLLRNTEDELPARLVRGKDIDVLIQAVDRPALHSHLRSCGFRRVRHPHATDPKLYGVHEFDFFRMDALLLDCHYELVCRSTDRGQWIPLDEEIQKSAWENAVGAELANESILILGLEDRLVTTVVRCVFDKRGFPEWHRGEITRLLHMCDRQVVAERLSKVFFSFVERLLTLLDDQQYDEVIPSYFSFSEY